jgi:sulfoxide reductase heme-binding subunit YedZ
MAGTAATGGLTSLWFLTRGTGVVSLILLTLTVALGVGNVRRTQLAGWPRFVIDAVHRNASLMAVAFLAVHIITAVLDPFAPIKLADAVIPFISAYRPIWLGLGAVAFDLLIAVVITSLWRRRLGYRAWRAIHWAAYACWPIAVVHGLGTGTDAKTKWMLIITGACVIVVILAVAARTMAGWPDHLGVRTTGLVSCVALPIALLVWLSSGPLAAGWAKRAGTPASVLAAASGTPVSATTSGTGSSGASAPANASFSSSVQGKVTQSSAGGLAQIHIVLFVSGQRLSALHILIEGQPINGGGVQMTRSSVTLGPASDPHQYRGSVTGLQGTTIAASVRDAAGHSYNLVAQLQLDQQSQSASGTVTATAGR